MKRNKELKTMKITAPKTGHDNGEEDSKNESDRLGDGDGRDEDEYVPMGIKARRMTRMGT